VTERAYAVTRIPRDRPEDAADAQRRTGRCLGATLSFLRRTLRQWCRGRGLQLVWSELCSCYRRIRLSRKNKWGLAGLPLREFADQAPAGSSRDRMELCTESIQTLWLSRRYLTLADVEIFLQGWLAAEKCCRGSADIQSHKQVHQSCGDSHRFAQLPSTWSVIRAAIAGVTPSEE